MSESTSQQRISWRAYECEQRAMERIPFGPDQILVAPPTVDAWRALAAVFAAHRYDIRIEDTDSYNCRPIKGGTGKSLHSYGIALDVNWETNPYKTTPGGRQVKFSTKATQAERANDVKRDVADTDMTRELIDDVLAIKTNNGKRVFEWGGNWTNVKDTMHFEIDVKPEDLESGIDWSTVRGRPVGAPMEGATREEGFAGVTERPPYWAEMLQQTEPISLGERGVKVEMLQRMLTDLGYSLGAIDGKFGSLTREALLAFQTENNLPPTGVADAATFAAFGQAQQRRLSRERLAITADLLRKLRSGTINAADKTKLVALVSSILGALGIGNSAVVQMANSTGPAAAAPPNFAKFLVDVQQLLAKPQPARADIQPVLDAAKQLQSANIKQVLTPENAQLLNNIKAFIPADQISKTPELAELFRQIGAVKPPMQTMFDVLPTFFADGTAMQMIGKGLSVAATSVIPGFGGSLVALGVGLAANYFANNVINTRVRDHATGANINR